MEIERKYLVKYLPEDLESYPHSLISQAYISTSPVIRIRRNGERFILTVKSSGLISREEYELLLTEGEHLLGRVGDFEQLRRHFVHLLVRALGGEHHGHQQLEGRVELKFARSFRHIGFKPGQDL